MAWQTILHKGRDKIVLLRDGVELANIVIASSSRNEVVNLSIEAIKPIELEKVAQ